MTLKKAQTNLNNDNANAIIGVPQLKKKSYLRPILIKYGLLTNLTGAGTGSKVESTGHPSGHPRP
jgi:hypothetical protein